MKKRSSAKRKSSGKKKSPTVAAAVMQIAIAIVYVLLVMRLIW